MAEHHPKSCCALSRGHAVFISADKEGVRSADTQDMVYIPEGEFVLGTDDEDGIAEDGERIRRKVYVKPFYMDKYAVTNAQFARFVEETGYVTDAERYGWSYVFHLFVPFQQIEEDILGRAVPTPWWVGVKGANWRHPEGRHSTIEDRMNHPVVHISWNDAQAYARWAGKRLPTEAEWEYAAASGVVDRKFPWGQELEQDGRHHCNVWQGEFPVRNTAEDGYLGTAPVDSFEPNAFGLYNMVGNVWEWCEDVFTHRPTMEDEKSLDPSVRLIKGGSYLCHHTYCKRYRIAARTFNTVDSSTGHMGFRCVADARRSTGG